MSAKVYHKKRSEFTAVQFVEGEQLPPWVQENPKGDGYFAKDQWDEPVDIYDRDIIVYNDKNQVVEAVREREFERKYEPKDTQS